MKEKNQELSNRELDMMLKYVPHYTQINEQHIKNKFNEKKERKKCILPRRKVLVIGIAATLVLASTLVYAEVVGLSGIYTLIFGEKASYLEEYINPLEETGNSQKDLNEDIPLTIQSEYDGIVMKLISAINDENTLRIFATVTDTTGDRLNKSLDFLSWGLNQGYGGNISVVDYQHETKTAFIMITSLGSDHQGTATLTINDFMTERKFFEDLPEVSVQVEDLIRRTIVDSMPQEMVTKRGGSYEQKNLLTVDALSIPFENAGQFTISNIGFVDGQLHIQVKTILGGDELNAGYYISAQFGDEQNKRLYEPTAVFDFIADKKYAYSEAAKEPHANYTELIYSDINSVEQLEGMSMFIDYMQPPQISKGTWTFSFDVPEKVSQVLAVNRELPINGEDMYIEAIAISPLGITLTLPKNISGEYEHMDHLRYRN